MYTSTSESFSYASYQVELNIAKLQFHNALRVNIGQHFA